MQSTFKGLFKKAVNPEKISPKDEGKTHFQIKQTNKNNNLKRVTNRQTFTAWLFTKGLVSAGDRAQWSTLGTLDKTCMSGGVTACVPVTRARLGRA